MKKYVNIEIIVSKENESEISELEYEKLLDDLIDLVESKNMMCTGMFKHLSEEELNTLHDDSTRI